jgi:hypothetical protein
LNHDSNRRSRANEMTPLPQGLENPDQ